MFLFSLSFFAQAAEYGTLYSLSDMNELSSRIVQAEVKEKRSYIRDGKIYSMLTLDVQETFTGIDEQELSIEVLGGEVDGVEMQVSGLPKFETGTESLFFLDHDRILGFGQGMYHIEKDVAVRPKLAGLPAAQFDIETLPSEQKAESCLAPMLETHYAQGWNLKNMYAHHTATEVSNVFPFTTYEGLQYKILVCSDGNAQEGVLSLTDGTNNEMQNKRFAGREEQISFHAQDSGLYITRIELDKLQQNSISSGFAVAILYLE